MTITFHRADSPLASVVIVTYGGWEWTRQTLEALRDHGDVPYELIVVDNASPDETPSRLRDSVGGATVVLNDRNLGFGQAANEGARLAVGRFLVFLNSDALVRPGAFQALTDALERDPLAGAAVPRYLNRDGSVQEAGGLLFDDGSTRMWGHGARADEPAYRFRRYVDYGSAACLVVRRSVFRALGGFDAAYRPMYVEDVDLALALRARGLRTVYEPRAQVMHVRFGSSGLAEERARQLVERNTPILRARWGGVLDARPPLDDDSPVTLLAARDADAAPRVLILAAADGAALVRALGEELRLGRVTFLVLSGSLADREREALLAGGVEVADGAVDAPEWLRGRLFHYDAVVRGGGVPPELAATVEETQPQAAEVAIATADDVLAELERHGIVPERVALR